MLQDVIDETLQSLTPSELNRLRWSVDIWERAGQMTASEASTWRAHIRAWQRRRSAGSRGMRAESSLATFDSTRGFKTLD